MDKWDERELCNPDPLAYVDDDIQCSDCGKTIPDNSSGMCDECYWKFSESLERK